jgi:hypothetical protein
MVGGTRKISALDFTELITTHTRGKRVAIATTIRKTIIKA